MKKVPVGVALGVLLWCVGCAPRNDLPPDVQSLRHQRGRATIALPVWSIDVVEEVATDPAAYQDKTLVIDRVYLDPARSIRIDEDTVTFPLRDGGVAIMAKDLVPPVLRQWTGAPLKLRAVLHPPRGEGDRQAPVDPILRGRAIDFARPLELACVEIEHASDGAWLTASIENYRAEPAAATLEVRFGSLHEQRRIAQLAPGETARVRLKLFGLIAPRWPDLRPQARSLRLAFDDGSAVEVDLGRWLDQPAEALVNLGYSFTPPANAVLALSKDGPQAELERFAGLELRSYLGEFSDANIEPREPESTEALPDLPLLVVGTAAHNPLAASLISQAKLADRIKAAGPEGYVLKSLAYEGRPALLVTAQTPRGLVGGVYGLLARYGVQFTMGGARLPAHGQFRVIDVDEACSPAFSVRRLVGSGPEATWTSRWSQWQWISMFDQASKNRFNQVVMPLDGLETTFTYQPGRSRTAVFPYVVGPYSCVAEAYLAHQRGLAVLADYARRLNLALLFAHTDLAGKLVQTAPPDCVAEEAFPVKVGEPIDGLTDPGDLLGLIRVSETAARAADLLKAKSDVLCVPYRRGAGARNTFAARFAWDPQLTPKAFFTQWAATLTDGENVARLAQAAETLDQLSGDILAAAPPPLGLGPALDFPVAQADLACDWPKLQERAKSKPVADQAERLKAQVTSLRDLQARLEPVYQAVRDARDKVPPPWEDPLFEAVPASRRAERISERILMLRATLNAFASVQEGALSYTTALAEPEQALPRLRVAATRDEAALKAILWIRSKSQGADIEPALTALAGQVDAQADLLDQWLGPANQAEPIVRLRVQGSDAVVHLFRTRDKDIYAAYMLAGPKVVELRLPTEEVRLFRRGQESKTVRAVGGSFLIDLDTVPTYIVARRAPWPGEPSQ